MKTRLLPCILVLLSHFCWHATANTGKPTLVIDTAGKTAHDYRNFLLLLSSVGFAPKYKSFFSFLSNPKIDRYETVFFIMAGSATNNLKSNHVQKCIKAVEQYAQLGDKNIGILLSGSDRFPIYINKATRILTRFGVPMGNNARPNVEAFLKTIFQHDMKKGKLYGTTLVNKHNKANYTSQSFKTMVSKRTGNIVFTVLPRTQHEFSPLIKKTFPIGLFVKNEQRNNNYFITKVSECTFSEMTENFFSTPLNFSLRQERLKALAQTLKEFQIATVKNHMPRMIKHEKIKLPQKLTKQFNVTEKKRIEKRLKQRLANNKHYQWILERPLSCTLLAPGDYFLHERKPAASLPKAEKKRLKKEAMQRGMDYIYNADLNLLWFEFNPESFFSIFNKSKASRNDFIKRVRTLAKELKKRFARGKKQMPKIFIGTDITTNYRSHPVPIATKDFYGKTYSKIPSPLAFDRFWKQEVLAVFDELVNTLGKSIPIDGIFFDFEMYHAQKQAASYSPLMDFSDLAWKIYAQNTQQPHLLHFISVEDRVTFLINQNQFDRYFAILQKETQKIGEKIRTHIKKSLPHALIGAYAQTLPTSWFYRGIMAGLSSPQEPLILATFNTDFYSHAQWLEHNGIYLIHGAPILLSKIKSIADLKLIPELLKHHFFVWYNRSSRMIYPPEQRKNIWWDTEASPLDFQTLSKEIQKQTKLSKSTNKL